MNWLELSVQIVIAGVIAGGFYFAHRQIKATVNANRASNFFDLVAYLQTDKAREDRKTVHQLKSRPFKEWKDDEDMVASAQNVASYFDIAAVAMKNGLIDPKVFAAPWKTSIVSTFHILSGYIKDRQEATGDELYLAHYVGLARYLDGESETEDGPHGVKF